MLITNKFIHLKKNRRKYLTCYLMSIFKTMSGQKIKKEIFLNLIIYFFFFSKFVDRCNILIQVMGKLEMNEFSNLTLSPVKRKIEGKCKMCHLSVRKSGFRKFNPRNLVSRIVYHICHQHFHNGLLILLNSSF